MGGGEDGITLVFEPSGAAFDVVGAGEPQYWAISLVNFISAFPQSSPATDRHPLRLYPTPLIPEDLPADEREPAFEAANERNGLILFEFGGKPGFVERLPDYDKCENDLREGKSRTAATAVIVGEVGGAQMTSRLSVPRIVLSRLLPVMVQVSLSELDSGARLRSESSRLFSQPGSRRSVLPSLSLSRPSLQAGLGAGGSGGGGVTKAEKKSWLG